jgi:hypothetical protein
MDLKFDFSELESMLLRLSRNISSLDGQEVPFSELFDAPFMLTHTPYNTFDEFLEAGEFRIESADDWSKISEEELNRHVATHSAFASWDEMKSVAGAEWVKRKLES